MQPCRQGLEIGRLTLEKICHAELVSVVKPDFFRSPAPTRKQQLSKALRAMRPIVTHHEVLYADTFVKKYNTIR
jgi:hypothetical protein